MKNWWKVLLRMAIPSMQMAAEYYREMDENDTGQDDLIAMTLDYVVALCNWILAGGVGEPPKTPEGLS